MYRKTYIAGTTATLLFIIGCFFRWSKILGATIIIGSSIALFLLGFLIPFFLGKISIESRRNAKRSLSLIFIIVALLIVFWFSQLLHWTISEWFGYLTIIMTMIFFIFFAIELEGRKLTLNKDRQLAAIFFSDVVGYTALMQENEEVTLTELQKNQTLQKKLIKKHRGKWLKDLGDGLMAVFFTASEAAQCALEIQQETSIQSPLKLHIGIHIAEVVFTDTDIFGDGVNIAARIANQCGAGEIFISESVFHNIRNRKGFLIEPKGEMELKNVSFKMKLYNVKADNHTESTSSE